MLRAKQQIPGINKHVISRTKLESKLEKALDSRLTLVVAPAGYGKTTAVLDWLAKRGLPAAWLSLDAADNDLTSFWRYACSALDDIVADIGKETEYVFSSQELTSSNIQVEILIDLLAQAQSDFLLVLDDLHLIDNPSILAGLSYLIDYLPERMHLVVISRTDPQINLARHRIKWQAQRLDEADLRFDREEILRFYEARGYRLDSAEVKTVEDYTEGWAAALVAVAMSIKDGGGRCDAIAALTRSGRDIWQYLKDEVIRAWRPEMRSFAMKISILDAFSEALCNAVAGTGDARDMLREIGERSGFLVAIDGRRQEHRFHHLFRNFLHNLLTETCPAEIPGLHLNAAGWFRENGLIPEAIDHLLCGGLYGEALEIIEHQIDPMIHRNEFAVLLSWIDRLPEAYRNGSFKISVIYANYYAEINRYDLSRQWVDRMKSLMADPKYASIPGWNNYGDIVCMLTEANLLVREGNLGFLPLLVAAAGKNMDSAFKMPEFNDFNMADIYYYRCPINKAARLFGEAPDQYGSMTDRYRALISKNPGYAPLGIGEYLYENNRLDEALPHLLKAMEEARAACCPGALVPAMVDIARIRRAQGDVPGAVEALDECEKELHRFGKAHWIYLIQAFRCRLHLDSGDVSKAEEWFASRKLGIFTEINRVREFELIVYARMLAASGRPHDAGALLQRLLTFAEDSGRLHSLVEVLNLLAQLSFKNSDMTNAMNYLEKSLKIGMDEGLVRSYLDEPGMARLLKFYAAPGGKQTEDHAAGPLTAYAKGLLKKMAESHPAAQGACGESATGLPMPQLTAQEKKVLELLVEAHTNKEIGEKLGIGIRTVKTHTGNIYGKLGVKNRAQCVRMAREYGIGN